MTLDRNDCRKTAEGLIRFLEDSPTSFHAVENIGRLLCEAGFTQLHEGEAWELRRGGSYFVTRNQSSILSFKIPLGAFNGFHLIASHSDSPSFKIKENPEMEAGGHYIKLNVEKYGGMLCAPWMDRPLSVAGRLVVREGKRLVTKLVKVDRDLLMIPNLAIHFNREVNDGYKYNPQVDMLPLYGDASAKGTFMKTVAESAGVREKDVLGHDLFLYSRTPGTIWGADGEFISCGRLDDLQCAFASLKGFLEGENSENVSVHAVFDNEEVGSGTKQGADSTFLEDTLKRINRNLGRSEEEYLMSLASSFMISADNAHAVHPNLDLKADPTNRPYMNEGIVIKYNANQKYTTDAVSAAMFKVLCQEADVPFQTFANRSDMPGGSTLGNISNAHVALNTVDIGLPQLAMHSPYETAGIKDTCYLVQVAKHFYSAGIRAGESGSYEII
ncbi:M18 family aminopeptidase [Enterocloster citroniae]